MCNDNAVLMSHNLCTCYQFNGRGNPILSFKNRHRFFCRLTNVFCVFFNRPINMTKICIMIIRISITRITTPPAVAEYVKRQEMLDTSIHQIFFTLKLYMCDILHYIAETADSSSVHHEPILGILIKCNKKPLFTF